MQQVITALQACIPKRRPHAPAGGSPAAAAESAPPPGPKTARSRNQTQTVGSNRAGTATPACATYCEGCGSAQCSGRPHRPTHSPSRSVPLATAPAAVAAGPGAQSCRRPRASRTEAAAAPCRAPEPPASPGTRALAATGVRSPPTHPSARCHPRSRPPARALPSRVRRRRRPRRTPWPRCSAGCRRRAGTAASFAGMPCAGPRCRLPSTQ
mmetsp:Transcript_15034/g.44322  ORF Transcript_15034/g.44322 Transcript_15034/m.44322 type:complete len:211 (+) Transcript_15034:994-1626(+)